MLRRSLLGLSVLTWLCLPGLAAAKSSVVGLKSPTSVASAPVKTGKSSVQGFRVVEDPAPIKVAKQSVVGQKPAPSNGSSTKSNGSGYSDNVPGVDAKATTAITEVGKEVKAPKNAGYDKGFFIQTDDGKYKLVFSGYAQFHFEYDRNKGENKFGFRVRRARLTFAGNIINKSLTYKFQIDLVKFKDELLLDAYVNYKFYEQLEVRFGQQTVPYIRQHWVSSSEQMFIDRSLASIEFINAIDQDTDKDGLPDKRVRNGRDVGLMVHGRANGKKLEYYAGIFNGSGTNTINVNNDFLYAARAVYNIKGDFGYSESDYDFTTSPAFFFGASGFYNEVDLSADKLSQLGAETGVKYKGLAMTGELFYRNTKPGDVELSKTNDYGYYAQAGYFVMPKRIEVAARASQIFLEGLQNDKAEFQLGLNGYPLKSKNLKLQSDYSVLPTATKTGIETSQRFRLRLQTKF
ncbi:MAG TPA: porin [bacterium]|nr:porin [bacterium]